MDEELREAFEHIDEPGDDELTYKGRIAHVRWSNSMGKIILVVDEYDGLECATTIDDADNVQQAFEDLIDFGAEGCLNANVE